jgi:hypothetical protein
MYFFVFEIVAHCNFPSTRIIAPGNASARLAKQECFGLTAGLPAEATSRFWRPSGLAKTLKTRHAPGTPILARPRRFEHPNFAEGACPIIQIEQNQPRCRVGRIRL